jgi:hypothetical protein
MNDYLTLFTEQKKTKKVLGIAPSLPSKGTNDGNDGDSLNQVSGISFGIQPQPLSCPNCVKPLTTSGAYHFWCESGHYDLQLPIPEVQRSGYCKFCHHPFNNGACEACGNQTSSTIAERKQIFTASS